MTEYEKYLNILSIVYYILAAVVGLISIYRILPEIAWALGLALGIVEQGPYPAEAIIGGLQIAGYGILFLAIALTIAWLLMSTAGKLRRHEGHTFCVVIAALFCVVAPTTTMNPWGAANVGHVSAIPSSMVLGALTLLVLTREPVKHLFGVRLTPMPPAEGRTASSPESHSPSA